jgi:hypothetical protein
MKLKENGLKDYGYIELIDDKKELMTLTPEQELGQEVFCAGWPAVLKYLTYLKDKIKNPIWKVIVYAGLSLIDSLHNQTCNQS